MGIIYDTFLSAIDLLQILEGSEVHALYWYSRPFAME